MDPQPKTKVLLLDDERFLLDLYTIVFEKNGYEVTAYNSADDALGAIRTGYDPDIILFDITMPGGKSGYEFLEILGKEGLAKRSMKIALTNEGQDGEKTRLTELGADGHLLKSAYIPSQLANIVTDMLTAKRSEGKK
jgi:CheY-like chemotaxis protein